MPCYQQTSGSIQWSNPAAEGTTSIQGRHGSGGNSTPAQWRRVRFGLHFNPDFVRVIKASLSHYRQELLCFVCPGWCADSDVWMWCCVLSRMWKRNQGERSQDHARNWHPERCYTTRRWFSLLQPILGLISAPGSPWTWGWILKDTPTPDSYTCCWHRKVLGPFFCLGRICCS